MLNAQINRFTLEPTVNFMAPTKVCLIMHALNKGTFDEKFVIRHVIDAIVTSQNLLPPMQTQMEMA